jgi:hypothetical protein
MTQTHHSDDASAAKFSVAWRLRDVQAVERELQFAFGPAPDKSRWVKAFLGAFERELRSHPIEWPVASRSPSEHTWEFERVRVCYRLIPRDQAVEILSLTSPHTSSDATRVI